MNPGRLAAFSDGVLAIVITIMVLGLQLPPSGAPPTFAALVDAGTVPTLLAYVLSFAYVAIYWNNHHHLLTMVSNVTGPVMWANMHLLFWLSLVPFTTAWMGRNVGASAPAVLYGVVLLLCAYAYFLLTRAIIRTGTAGSGLVRNVGSDRKATVSVALYVVGVVLAVAWTPAAYAAYGLVALMWIVPDRGIERAALDDT